MNVAIVQMVRVPFRGRSELLTRAEAESLWNQLGAVLCVNSSSMATIVKYVCATYNVTEFAIHSRARPQNLAWARHVAIYLCRRLTPEPATSIGKFFGRDDGTVSHSINAVENRIQVDVLKRAEVVALEKLIFENANQLAKEKAA